jgi:hypothetical protein
VIYKNIPIYKILYFVLPEEDLEGREQRDERRKRQLKNEHKMETAEECRRKERLWKRRKKMEA